MLCEGMGKVASEQPSAVARRPRRRGRAAGGRQGGLEREGPVRQGGAGRGRRESPTRPACLNPAPSPALCGSVRVAPEPGYLRDHPEPPRGEGKVLAAWRLGCSMVHTRPSRRLGYVSSSFPVLGLFPPVPGHRSHGRK